MSHAIYHGRVRHRRFEPRAHRFSYPLFMVFLDLGRLDDLVLPRWLFSVRGMALARFRRCDYLGDPELSLEEAVRRLVAEHTGRRPQGPIGFLGHLRSWGHYFSPVNFYYCFDTDGAVETVVAEIVNTPWGERYCYVLTEPSRRGEVLEYRLRKDFHVSPFMAMDQGYLWKFSPPAEQLVVHMESYGHGGKLFDATLSLERRPLTTAGLARAVFLHPWLSVQVLAWIYFQAARLWGERLPFYTHPKKRLAGGE